MKFKALQIKALKRLPTVLEKALMCQRLAYERTVEQLRHTIPVELISAAQELVKLYREIDERRALAGRHSASHSVRTMVDRAEFTKQYMLRWMRTNGWDSSDEVLWESIFIVAEERVGPRLWGLNPWTGEPAHIEFTPSCQAS